MATIAELQAMRETLVQKRFAGIREYTIGSRRLVYQSDAEMGAALQELDRQIAALSGTQSVSTIVFRTSKGL